MTSARHSLSGNVLAAPLDEELGRARGDPYLHPPPVGLLDDVDELAVADVGIRDDQLVDLARGEHRGQRGEPAEDGKACSVGRARDRADELVLDPAAARAKGPSQPREVLALADENCAPPDAGELEQVAGDDVIAAPKQPDADRRQHDRGRGEPVRAKAMAGPEREDHRDHRDDDERADHLCETGAPLTCGVEAGLPEDEDGDHRQKRKPVGLGLPEEPPERHAFPVDEVAKRERGVDAEHEADEIEHDQRDDAARPADPGSNRHVRTARPDVADHTGVGVSSPAARDWFWRPRRGRLLSSHGPLHDTAREPYFRSR